jgi:hypothetical protein
METTTLGRLLAGGEERDAIHVAVAPVVASEVLSPGQHVGFVLDGNSELVGKSASPIGIVDPYLTQAVAEGQRFYLCLYPQSVTGLRHDWTHPAFPAVAAPADKSAAVAWITDFAAANGMDYDDVIEAADDWVKYRHYAFTPSRGEGAREFLYEGDNCREFWRHYEAVTGRKLDGDDKQVFFTCSC